LVPQPRPEAHEKVGKPGDHADVQDVVLREVEAAPDRNAIAPRGILTFDEWDPATSRGRVGAPLLLLASRADRFTPFHAVEAYAAATPHARFVEVEGDHFEVYASPARERAADLAAEFLAGELH
jgi:fermentation-respiration switch protein FrsA (DUF1100 family)